MEPIAKTMRHRNRFSFRGTAIAGLVTAGALALTHAGVQGQTRVGGEALQEPLQNPNSFKGTATFPVVFCWYKGQPALYIQTDASDVSTAEQQGVNLVPRLANAINAPGGAVDDIYKVANFKQGNIIPSAPIPAGPTNSDLNYTPLWQVTVVTWRPGITPHILKSEEELFAARDAGLVVLQKTDIVLNCPVIYTPFGGQLQTVKIGLSDGDKRDRN
jgi:hypothetical protein